MKINIKTNIPYIAQTYLFICLFIVLSFFSFFFIRPLIVSAQSAAQTSAPLDAAKTAAVDELQKKIDARNKNIDLLNKEIQQYQDIVDKTSKEAMTLQKTIKVLETNGKAMELDIKNIRQKIDVSNLDINKLDIVIGQSNSAILRYKEEISQNIREIHEKDNTGVITLFLGNKSMSQFLNDVDQLFQVNKDLQLLNVKLSGEKQKSEESKISEIDRKNDLVKLQTELNDKKKVIEYNKKEQQKVLTDTKNNEKTFQQIVKDKTVAKAAFEKEVFDYESQLKYTLDPSKLPKVGTNAFSWPVDNVIITQRFGKTVASKRLYVSGSHNGVDFGARTGTPVKALSTGVILGTGDTDLTCPRASFGRWVLIKFDNGLATTYGHLSVISTKQGNRVQTGDIIGYSGNTGYSTGPHVHISAYAANAVSVQNRPSAACGGKVYTLPIAPTDGYLDPMLYFPAYNK